MTTTLPQRGAAATRGIRQSLPGLLSLSAGSCLAVTTEILPIGLLPAIGHNFGVSASVTGLLITLYATMVATLSVPLTLLTARFGRKNLLLATLMGYALSNALVAAAPAFAMVAAGRVIGGISHALFFSLCIGYVPRLVDGAFVGRALGIAAGGASVGFVLGVPLSTSLGNALGWRVSFAVLAGVSLVITALVYRLLPRVPGAHPRGTGTGRRANLIAVVSANTLAFLGQFTAYTYISLLLLSAGVSTELVGPILLIYGACGAIGVVCAAKTLDRNPRRTAVIVLVLVGGGLLVVALGHPALGVLLVAAAVWNGAFGGVPSIFQASALRTHAVSPELAGAWVNTTANIGIAGGAALGGGVLATVGIVPLPWIGIGLTAAALVIVVMSRRAFPSQP